MTKKRTIIILIGFIVALTFYLTDSAAIDAPHQNAGNIVGCQNCHVGPNWPFVLYWFPPFTPHNIDETPFNMLCLSCHVAPFGPYTEMNAPKVKTHSSVSTSSKYGEWTRQCIHCHKPHKQLQKNYQGTDANNLNLAQGTIESCVYNAVGDTSTLTYSTITYKEGWEWNPPTNNKLLAKTGNYRRTLLFPNVDNLTYDYSITAVDSVAQTIKVKGDATINLSPPTTFAVMYGQFVKDLIDVSGTNTEVKFFDQTGTNSFADGDGTYDGVCEVCHTQTKHYRNDGSGTSHYPADNCSRCHSHIDGFAHGGGGGTGAGCEDCHGKDGGAGTTVSHSTHMENDADDLKGPHITCGDCHDTNNYPKFRDGKNLSETTVCDTCHSPSGSYNGVNSVSGSIGAKDNWRNGVYNGSALATGKEKWCVGCHDDEPAYSKAEAVTPIILDDPAATYVCGWGWRYQEAGYYGAGYRYHAAGTGSCTATWRPNVPKAGYYKVYAWWQARGDRATNAKYTVYYDGGSETIQVSQQGDGEKWNLLGTFLFAAGTSGRIELNDNADNNVIADAIMLTGSGTDAPNVIGDNSTFGYYITGHKINCLNCHDAGKNHIDHEQRTYEADESTFQAVNPYCDSYRLKDIDGMPCMIIPRPLRGAGTNPLNAWQDFALCFSCHNKYEVLSQTGAPGATNFWNNDSSPANSHNLHLGIGSYHFDSDWDSGHATNGYGPGRADSSETCIACHNVHGSPTKAMIRHGELISQYNIASSATWSTPSAFTAGTYYVYARWTGDSSRASNAQYTINFNGGYAKVSKDQRSQGGQWVLLGTFNFASGDSGSVVLDNEYADGYVIADAIGWDSDGTLDPNPEVIVDNTNATYKGYWNSSTYSPDYYGTNYQYQLKMRNKIPALNFSYLINDVDIATATWSAPEGSYYVYAWWSAYTNRATNAKYNINHTGGTDTLTVNQQINGGKWNQLGTARYDFVSGNSVVLSNDGVNGYVIADAIGLDIDGVFTGNPEIVIDNPEAAYNGIWTTTSGDTDKYGSDLRYHAMQGVPVSDPDATLEESVGGFFNYTSGQATVTGVCRACHGAVTYIRSPNLGPKIFDTSSDFETVLADGISTVLLTTWAVCPGESMEGVTINLSPLGGSANQVMYDDGTHGDETSGDNIYSFSIVVDENIESGTKNLPIMVSCTGGQKADGIILEVEGPGEIVWDNGGGDNLWSNPANWKPDGVPNTGDKVVFNTTSTANCIADTVANNLAKISLNSGYTGTVTFNSNFVGGLNELSLTGNLTVNSGTLLLAGDPSAVNSSSGGTADNPHGKGIIINASNIYVGASGKISANSQGFPGYAGPGKTNEQAAGGSYGGYGGAVYGSSLYPTTYGSAIEPTALGSGGGNNANGGIGGGAIKLVASDTITINGTVSANGGNGQPYDYGGGSGGSIWIISDTLSGTGSITANGGSGQRSGYAGGGGRVSLQWASGQRTFNGIISADNGSGDGYANRGTIWVNVPGSANPWNELWNATYPVNGSVAVPPGEYTIDYLHITNNSTLESQGNTTAINEASGGTAGNPHGSGVTINSSTITIDVGSAISANYLGFIRNQGPGKGNDAYAGGGYGGFGSGGYSYGGSPYGSASQPTALGSGGGLSTKGGRGGGAIKLNVSNTLTINGTVAANGTGGQAFDTGGGSGGSIWIVTDILTGSGTISADGGLGQRSGEGGGGGRISLQWASGEMTFGGIIRAQNGGNTSNNGTLYINVPGSANPWNELWNAIYPVKGSVTLLPGVYTIDYLHITNNATLEFQGNTATINEASGGTPAKPHGSGVTINSSTITIDEGASISSNYLGFNSRQGPGLQVSGNRASPGHGGNGGNYSSEIGGPTYGSQTVPSALGSGGGSSTGGSRGGGAIKLVVSDTLTVNGTIKANADQGHGYDVSGGSGGSIWIITDILAGSGSVSATGGNPRRNATGGAGGRVAVYYNVDSSSLFGLTNVSGGTGNEANGLGTVVWQTQ